ncbi:hypothetical protein [Alteromonas gracilis]|uniref:hypothetical protein n=1 Tax=Alteromonas gracilis TaxID=1479524 RepID=UPI0030D18D64
MSKHLLFSVIAVGSMMFMCASPAHSQQIQSAPSTDEPLRLEATIRGDKEQPRVLSIVPWQLPTHRNIEGTLSWKPQTVSLKPLDRTQFLRQMQLSQQFGVQALTNQDSPVIERD